MTHTILTTFRALAIGAAFYSPDSEHAFEFLKISDSKYATTYNGKQEVFKAAPDEPVEVEFQV